MKDIFKEIVKRMSILLQAGAGVIIVVDAILQNVNNK